MLLTATGLFLIGAPYPASACLPLPTAVVAPPAPTIEQTVQTIAQSSEHIVYGVLTRGITSDQNGVLRIIHVYKGALRAGARLPIRASWGFDPPMCAGLLGGPPPTPKGVYGVFAWSGEPASNILSDSQLSAMFKLGLIERVNGK